MSKKKVFAKYWIIGLLMIAIVSPFLAWLFIDYLAWDNAVWIGWGMGISSGLVKFILYDKLKLLRFE